LQRRPSFVRLREGSSVVEQVGPDSFEKVGELGKGAFGDVVRVKHKSSGQDYAMKIMFKRKVLRGNLLKYAITERNLLSYLRHPYIVRLHYAFQTQCFLVMVMQLCPCGSLQQLIDQEERLDEVLARLYSAEILLALEHLHERRIVFRDLKPDNVVRDAEQHCLLTDFGLSKEEVERAHGGKSVCGSTAFLAPEILTRREHGHVVDITAWEYSFLICLQACRLSSLKIRKHLKSTFATQTCRCRHLCQ